MGRVGQQLIIDEKSDKFKALISEKSNGKPYISLSFRYFCQQEFFGLKEQSNNWFISLIDRLKDFSGKTYAILDDPTERKKYRLHPINWNSKNIPIQIDDLVNIPQNIREFAKNEFDNSFFWQFQLSQSTGRVIGFFNPTYSIFYVVLLDPKHNIQPSADFGYRVDDTEIALTEYEILKCKIANIEEKIERCTTKKQICPVSAIISKEHLASNLCYFAIDEELRNLCKDFIEKGIFRKEFECFIFEKYMDEGDK